MPKTGLTRGEQNNKLKYDMPNKSEKVYWATVIFLYIEQNAFFAKPLDKLS